MQIRMLGPLEVLLDGVPVEIRGAKERALFVALALRAGSVVSADRLIDDVWGEDLPANPTNALQVRVSRLRKHLGDALETQAPGYRLAVDLDAVDIRRAEALIAAARVDADPAVSLAKVTEALALFRGDPLAEFTDVAAVRSEVARLESLRFEALEARFDAELALGRHGAIIGDLEREIADRPLREGLWSRLMVALYRAGRQADALRAFRDARAALGEELGIEPGPELADLEDRILRHDPMLMPDVAPSAPTGTAPIPVIPARPVAPLPQMLNSFVGRAGEVGQLRDLIKANRLVTITGPGGVGKTRLSVEVAGSLADHFAAHLVELAAVTASGSVAEAAAEALEIQTARGPHGSASSLDALTGLLADQRVILVLDNCEQVLDDAAAVIDHLLAKTSELRILATSRERLGLSHERVFPLAPLIVGESDEPGDAEVLFLERAVAVDPSTAGRSDLLPDVRAICARLDGIPLAIELAASRMAALSPSDILQRLDDRFALLTGGSRTAMPRHQTLRAAIDWSHEALSDRERLVFRRLSVVRGTWTLKFTAAVVTGEMSDVEAMDVVATLVDRSLVVRADAGAGRYRLLETIRMYAAERLAEAGEREATLRTYANHYIQMAHEEGPHHRRIEQVEHLRAERDNIRHAIEALLDLGDVDEALFACGHLGYFWFTEALLEDERALIERAVAAGGSPLARARGISALLLISFLEIGFRDADALTLADEMVQAEREFGDDAHLVIAQFVQSVFYTFLGRPEGFALGEATRELAVAIDDQWVVGFCDVIRGMGVAAVPSPPDTSDAGGPGAARRLLERGVATLREVGEWWALSFGLGSLSRLLSSTGHYEEALALAEEGSAIARAHGTRWIEANLTVEAGNIQVLLGRYADAHASYAEGRRLAERIGSVSLRAFASNGFGMVAHWEGNEEEAVGFHAHAAELYRRISGSHGEALALDRMGFAQQRLGDLAGAFDAHFRALHLVKDGAEATALALSLEGLAGAFGLSGDASLGAALLGCASALRGGVGRPLPDAEAIDVRRVEAHLRSSMGSDSFGAAFAAGAEGPVQALVEKAVAARPATAAHIGHDPDADPPLAPVVC